MPIRTSSAISQPRSAARAGKCRMDPRRRGARRHAGACEGHADGGFPAYSGGWRRAVARHLAGHLSGRAPRASRTGASSSCSSSAEAVNPTGRDRRRRPPAPSGEGRKCCKLAIRALRNAAPGVCKTLTEATQYRIRHRRRSSAVPRSAAGGRRWIVSARRHRRGRIVRRSRQAARRRRRRRPDPARSHACPGCAAFPA